jgi:sugar lactone lactonase YvrE/pimeloyl-ACP methyl ester carboxylesterase
VAVGPDGTVYVADSGNSRIQRFSASGTFLGKWGSYGGSGDGRFIEPEGIAVAPDGTVYTSDLFDDRIQRFNATGAFLGEWQVNPPSNVGVAPDGTVYVTEAGWYRVRRFSATGAPLGGWGSPGYGDGQFNEPRGVAVAPDGTVYVVDSDLGHRIQRFRATGTFLGKWGSYGSGDGQFLLPYGVAVARDGTVYVADTDNHRIQIFSATGTFLGKWGSLGSGNGQFRRPKGVAVAPDGTIYVADTQNHRIQMFRVQSPGTPTPTPSSPTPTPSPSPTPTPSPSPTPTPSTITTPTPTQPPQPPSNLRSTDSNAGAVTLAWNDNSDNETGFYLYRWDGSVWVRIATLGANVTTYTDTDANCGQSRYRVSAYNIAGESAMSNEVAVAIRCPQPPSNLRSTDSNAGAVTLAWNDNSDNETGFYLYRWDNSGWSRIATLGANVTTYTDTDPNCGQSRYRVSAYNVAGESAMSNEVAVAIRCPLILIPGMMGSYIYRKGWPRNQLWPGVGDPFRDDALRNLGLEEVSVRDAIRTYVFLTTKTRIYSPLIDFLKGEGYIEYPPIDNEQVPSETPLERCQQAKQEVQKGQLRDKPTLFVFAYDWRQSNSVSAQKLKEYIDCVRSIHNGSRVDIIAHSMGGLVARRYLIDNPSNHRVARLITIATPFYGAARTMTVITTGKFPGVSDFSPIPKIFEGELKYVSEKAAGAHELLPSPAYGKQYPCFLRISAFPSGQERCASDKSYDVFEVWSKYFASGSALRARQFHEGAQDDWTGDADLLRPMPAYYHFVGYGKWQDTLSKITHSIVCLGGCRDRIIDASFDRGDGTVPIKSAEHRSYRHPQAQIIRINGEHTEMLDNTELKNALRNILQGTFSQSADLSNTDNLPVAEAYYLRAINVASLTITDSTGELPSTATFYQLDEDVYAAVLPTDGVYTATITLKAQEGAIIEMRNGTNDSTNRAVRYLDLPPGGNNQVQVVFSQTGFSYLKRDTDADGLFETDVPPSADVSGSGANDREAPIINVSASGPLNARTVTITATDASGVKQIFYSLDRTTFQPYTGPLVVDATQTQFIYTFADDRIANRSGLLMYPLAWKVYLPLTIR